MTRTDLDLVTRLIAAATAGSLRYRGVYRAAGPYVFGDVVTHQGSMWHCDADSTEVEPGTSPAPPFGADWVLCVKRGKRGTAVPDERLHKLEMRLAALEAKHG